MQFGVIVNASCKELRSLSRWALKGNWGKAVMASVLSLLIVNVPVIILSAILGPEKWSYVSDIYSMLVTAPLALGLSMVFLNIFRRRETSPMEIFYGFEFVFKAVAIQIAMGCLIFLQLLLFIIPGLIAVYRYSLAFFILADDPRKGIMQCITESKYLMVGNKMKMFLLSLSFFGWYFLAAIPMASVMMFMPVNDWLLFDLAILATGVLPCIVEPYMQVAMAAFYEIANGSLRVKRSSVYDGPDTFRNPGMSYDTSQNMGRPEQDVSGEDPAE